MSTASLDPCACKRGFFTLRDCERAATRTCDVCRRRICDEHRAPRVQATVCVECSARQAEDDAVEPLVRTDGRPGVGPVNAGEGPQVVAPEDATASTARYRRRYYDRHGYEPMWWGTHDSTWSGDGFRWYDDGTDDDGGGFGDS
ncbi:hypothetical protein [Patulibacter minatonensis]|uniref:hypothetical protein n=1 Tax=Patulibacter minatonensis TaxID=298163 RepID=UPI0004797E85|nr:hypothetical protein [Patulibacter minatonensis]